MPRFITVLTHENDYEFRVRLDVDPDDDYHCTVSTKFVEHYEKVMTAYNKLMDELARLFKSTELPRKG